MIGSTTRIASSTPACASSARCAASRSRSIGGAAGVEISALIFDAGPVNSPALLRVGPKQARRSDPDDPTTLHDVFFRIGGPHLGKATVSLEGWGLGSYCFFNVDPTIHATRAFEVPVRPGVRLHDILTLSITNIGTIDHVVNDVGPPTPPDTSPVNIVEYP